MYVKEINKCDLMEICVLYNQRWFERKKITHLIMIALQICQNVIRSNVAAGSRAASGFSEKGTPLTFLTEDEQVMKETGKRPHLQLVSIPFKFLALIKLAQITISLI